MWKKQGLLQSRPASFFLSSRNHRRLGECEPQLFRFVPHDLEPGLWAAAASVVPSAHQRPSRRAGISSISHGAAPCLGASAGRDSPRRQARRRARAPLPPETEREHDVDAETQAAREGVCGIMPRHPRRPSSLVDAQPVPVSQSFGPLRARRSRTADVRLRDALPPSGLPIRPPAPAGRH